MSFNSFDWITIVLTLALVLALVLVVMVLGSGSVQQYLNARSARRKLPPGRG